MTRKSSLVAERQAPLRREYVEDPERATTVKWAATETSAETDALHSVVHIGRGYGVSQLAIDRAVKVGFRSMTCRVHLRVPSDIDPHRIATVRKQAEHSCGQPRHTAMGCCGGSGFHYRVSTADAVNSA